MDQKTIKCDIKYQKRKNIFEKVLDKCKKKRYNEGNQVPKREKAELERAAGKESSLWHLQKRQSWQFPPVLTRWEENRRSKPP
jgi:hypothetical protein